MALAKKKARSAAKKKKKKKKDLPEIKLKLKDQPEQVEQVEQVDDPKVDPKTEMVEQDKQSFTINRQYVENALIDELVNIIMNDEFITKISDNVTRALLGKLKK